MQEITLAIFLLLSTIILLIFIGGLIFFIVQYRKRKIDHKNEKHQLQKEHQLQLIQTHLESQLQTMQFIGREIHDNVGQKLTLASIYCNSLTKSNPATVKQLIDDSLQELRLLSKSLTDPLLTQLSLFELIQKEANLINASGTCYVWVKANETTIILPHAVKMIVVRLLQEFIQNSLKHAKCRNIYITIFKQESELKISIKDDGIGFNTQTAKLGSGLNNMRRRSEELNALFELNSTAGLGTTLNLTFAL